MEYTLFEKKKKSLQIFLETQSFTGVQKIAEKIADDFLKITDERPQIVNTLQDTVSIAIGTYGNSELIDSLCKAKVLDAAKLEGKREVYVHKLIDHPCKTGKLLVVAGSDKRGTIYGMFSLTEYFGMTAMNDWGDVAPQKRKLLTIPESYEYYSKEPSVKYRGFFINDEWPAFGTWTTRHFDGFTVKMYDHIFEYLLRMKGNYLWPAMWSSSFLLDGPGMASAELADEYGIVICFSHHEPCLRSSEEWDLVRGEDTKYGNEWNYFKNKQGLLTYWKEGLKRSGHLENMITIGMRGERDSSMLGENSTLYDNISLLKEIIHNQKAMIRECVKRDTDQIPMMLALYKEVEAYYYGDETTEGLNAWDELDDVILMLCEDNHGNMRTLPTEEMRKHKGGYGMYYHFDYHGDPVSYEWVASMPLTKTWEQMSMAYDYGIRDLWIVNVGDVKFQEYPLQYFMNLAYDFEKWGTTAPNQTHAYTKQWISQQFGKFVDDELCKQIQFVVEEYVRLNHYRRPEALNSKIYHPLHFNEGIRMLKRAQTLSELNRSLRLEMPPECRDAYYSMIYFPAEASSNLLQMHLCAGLNEAYANMGWTIANDYANRVQTHLLEDELLAKEFAAFAQGKWSGMELPNHIGFTHWNDEDYRIPLQIKLTPVKGARLTVARSDSNDVYTCGYFNRVMELADFLDPNQDQITLNLANGGDTPYSYRIVFKTPAKWLEISQMSGNVDKLTPIKIHLLRNELDAILPDDTSAPKEAMFSIERVYEDHVCEKIDVRVLARHVDYSQLPEQTLVEGNGYVAIKACHFKSITEAPMARYVVLEDYGKHESGVKMYPTTMHFSDPKEAPILHYSCYVNEGGDYDLILITAPHNPLSKGGSMMAAISINEEAFRMQDMIPKGLMAGVTGNPEWTYGVMNGEHQIHMTVALKKGYNELHIASLDAPIVWEYLILHKENVILPQSYMGVPESYCTAKTQVR